MHVPHALSIPMVLVSDSAWEMLTEIRKTVFFTTGYQSQMLILLCTSLLSVDIYLSIYCTMQFVLNCVKYTLKVSKTQDFLSKFSHDTMFYHP